MMKATVITVVLALATASAVAAPVPPKAGPVTISRMERCERLDVQLQKALKTKRTARHASTARALRTKARRLCATRREAQGIRTYADALKLLGVRPIDDRRIQPKPVLHSKETRK